MNTETTEGKTITYPWFPMGMSPPVVSEIITLAVAPSEAEVVLGEKAPKVKPAFLKVESPFPSQTLSDAKPGKVKPPPKMGDGHFSPRKGQQIVKGWGKTKALYSPIGSVKQMTCKVVRRPGAWFSTHRCEIHDVLIIWKAKDGIPWS